MKYIEININCSAERYSGGIIIIPTRHRAALIRDFGKPLTIEEVPTPAPKDAEVLVKVISAGICHSDIHLWAGDYRPVGVPKTLPWILSHEITGVVVAKGDKVPETIKVGDRVLVYPWGFAEEDERTLSGYTQLARKRARLSIDIPGGLQEYLLVQHYRYIVNIDGLEDPQAVAPLACAGLTTYNAVKKIKPYVGPDEHVLVVGLGGLGTYAVQWIRALLPHANLLVADIRDEAIEFVSKLVKIDAAVNPVKEDPVKTITEITKGEGVKAVIDLVGLSQTIGTYLKTLTTLGVYAMVGLMSYEASIPVPHVIRNEIKIFGVYTGSLGDQHEVIKHARKGSINYVKAISKRFRFEEKEVNEAIKSVAEAKHLGRVIVVL
ncbi:MAG: hypothetical protein DJ555_05140 [Desulfurococcaceae archaeon]|nr:MAG: hypothetical protein DJ555_05140 [Desulfurococcaceae archaeon]